MVVKWEYDKPDELMNAASKGYEVVYVELTCPDCDNEISEALTYSDAVALRDSLTNKIAELENLAYIKGVTL